MPGESARINGRKGGRPALEATKYRQALIAEIEKHAKPLAEVLVRKGLEGDVPALKEINDRGLGKAPQAITNAEGGNFVLEISEVIAKKNGLLTDKS